MLDLTKLNQNKERIMKFRRRQKPLLGSFRLKTAFLLWPRTLPVSKNRSSDKETRWLGRATWIEKCVEDVYSPYSPSSRFWIGLYWVEDKE